MFHSILTCVKNKKQKNFYDHVQELLFMSDILIDNIINMRDRTFEFIHVYSL